MSLPLEFPAHLLIPYACDNTQSFATILMVNREFHDAAKFVEGSIQEVARERCRALMPTADEDTLACFKMRQLERLAMGTSNANELVRDGIFSAAAYDRRCNQVKVSKAFLDMFEVLCERINVGTAVHMACIHLFAEYMLYLYTNRRYCRLMISKFNRRGIRDRADYILTHKYVSSGRMERNFSASNVKKILDTARAILVRMK
jgi:hypothetical protein